MEESKEIFSRRKFLGSTATVGAMGVLGLNTLVSGCSDTKKEKFTLPTSLDTAPDGPLLKAGLIGCGSRGRGAAAQFLEAGPNLEISALGDIFQDQIQYLRQNRVCRKRLLVSGDTLSFWIHRS